MISSELFGNSVLGNSAFIGLAERGGMGIGADMIGFGALIIIVDARFGRGGLGPPGRVGVILGSAGSAETVVLGVETDGGVLLPVERAAAERAEMSFRGVDRSFSRLSVADCDPLARTLVFRLSDARKPTGPLLTADDNEVLDDGVVGV